MADAEFYRKQAELLLSWAAAADDPIVKEQLRTLAQDYLTMASLRPPLQPATAQSATAQQQQQVQPKTDED